MKPRRERPVPAGVGIPGSIARQPGSGLRHAAPQELGAGEVSAGAGAVGHPGPSQQAW